MLIVLLGVDGVVAQVRGARWVFPWLLLEFCVAVGTAIAFPHKHLGTLRQLLFYSPSSSYFLGPTKHARVEARSRVVSALLYLHDLAHFLISQILSRIVGNKFYFRLKYNNGHVMNSFVFPFFFFFSRS